jgi:hypothetical protein
MVKVIVASLNPSSGKLSTSVVTRRLKAENGEIKTLRTLNIGSKTFGNDLRYIFGKNVIKARQDNKRQAGQ